MKRKRSGRNKWGNPFLRDSDGDGVPNWQDCSPFNPKRQDEYFFVGNEMFIVDYVKYLKERYNMPWSEVKGLTFMFKTKDNMNGVPKTQLDAIGKAHNRGAFR